MSKNINNNIIEKTSISELQYENLEPTWINLLIQKFKKVLHRKQMKHTLPITILWMPKTP